MSISNIDGNYSYAYCNSIDGLNPNDALTSTYLLIDGTNYMTNNLNVNTHKIINVANATNPNDAVNLSQLTGGYVSLNTIQTISGLKEFYDGANYAMGISRSLSTGANVINFYNYQSANIEWQIGCNGSQNFIIAKNGTTAILSVNYTTPYLSLNTYQIKNTGDPTALQDVMTLNYANNNYVDFNSLQTIKGIKIFQDTTAGFGYVALARNTTSNSRTIRHLNSGGATIWSVGNESEGNENYIIYKNGTTPILTINYTTPSLSLNTYQIKNLANGTLSTDAINLSQLTGSLSGYVDLTTNQTIAGIKTFTSGTLDNQVIMNHASPKTNNYMLFNLASSTQWALGIQSDAISPRYDFTLWKDNTTPIFTVNYNTPSLSMEGYKIISLANPTNAQDAMTKNYADATYQLISNMSLYATLAGTQTFTGAKTFSNTLTMSGATIAMGANKITGLADPTLAQDASTKNYTDTGLALCSKLANTQTFTGANKFTEASSFGRIQLQRGASASYSIVQMLNESGSNIWDMGMDTTTNSNQFYLYGYGGATRYMTITTTGNANFRGNVCIGTTTPTYALEITKAGVSTLFGVGYAYGFAGGVSSFGITDNINVKSTASMWCITMFCTSDRRIKEKIYEINDDEALKVIRKLKPVGYEYKDKRSRKSGIEYGFIAQDVKEVMPNAVSIEKDYIPDIYDLGDYIITSNNQTLITLRTKLITDFKVGTKLKILDLKENEIICEILTINNYNSFIIDKNFNEIVADYELTEDDIKNNIRKNTVFIYGSYVEDLHVLDKNSIFSVSIGALQEIDRRQRKHNKQIEKLETQYNELMQILKNKNIL